jgi:hypothetical protein
MANNGKGRGKYMTISKCKHGIYLDGCRECFPIPEEVYKQRIEAVVKSFSETYGLALQAWNKLDTSNQTNLECARNWFLEGFAHGYEQKNDKLSQD